MEVPNLLCRYGTTGNEYVLPPIPGGSKEMTWLWKLVDWEIWRGKDKSWTLARDNVKSSWSGCIAVRTDPMKKHVLELEEETWKKIQCLCLFSLSLSLSLSLYLSIYLSISISLSPPDMLLLFVQLMQATQFSYSLSFSWWLLKKCSIE